MSAETARNNGYGPSQEGEGITVAEAAKQTLHKLDESLSNTPEYRIAKKEIRRLAHSACIWLSHLYPEERKPRSKGAVEPVIIAEPQPIIESELEQELG